MSKLNESPWSIFYATQVCKPINVQSGLVSSNLVIIRVEFSIVPVVRQYQNRLIKGAQGQK